jgi:CheY-like chemotaxis protein
LDKILQASHRAKDLIHHIQIFSRQAPVELKPVLLHAIVKEAMKLLRASIPSTIEFIDRIDDVGILLANPTQIHQIVMNLCTNAYHAMTESGGTISVTLTKDQIESDSRYTLLGIPPGNYAKFLVADTGVGIPKNIQEKIFDPYYTTKPEGEGTGLGLSVVHGIVKGLQGHIEVSSVQNQGTTFTIYLPLTETESAPPREEKRRVTKGNGETILVVDDDLTVLDLTIEMLKRLDYRPAGRSSAIEALGLYKSSPDSFQAVVTDFTMPGMDGLKLAEEIKKISPNIPILLCSGFGNIQAVNMAVQKGLVAKINKPVVLHEMAEAIRKCLVLQ